MSSGRWDLCWRDGWADVMVEQESLFLIRSHVSSKYTSSLLYSVRVMNHPFVQRHDEHWCKVRFF